MGQIWVLLLILIIKKDILVLGKGPTQGLENTLTAEKMYLVNFTVTKKKFCLSLHYNWANSYLFINSKEIIMFKAKDSEIAASLICLGNISKNWSTDNMKKTGLNGYVYEFNVDYRAINPSDIDKSMSAIYTYFMLKYGIL